MTVPKPWETGKPKPAPVQEAPKPAVTAIEIEDPDEPNVSGDPVVRRFAMPEGTQFTESKESSYAKKLRLRNEREYRPNEIAFRELYVREFVKDWHQQRAAIRAGVNPRNASAKSSELMQEEYVLRRIYDYIEEVDEETLLTRKRVIVGLMKEANNHGMGSSHGARVNAWKTLGKYLGMEITKIEAEFTHKGNVMVIPGDPTGRTIDAESWSESASGAQEELKRIVRD